MEGNSNLLSSVQRLSSEQLANQQASKAGSSHLTFLSIPSHLCTNKDTALIQRTACLRKQNSHSSSTQPASPPPGGLGPSMAIWLLSQLNPLSHPHRHLLFSHHSINPPPRHSAPYPPSLKSAIIPAKIPSPVPANSSPYQDPAVNDRFGRVHLLDAAV